jgi:hypothetical protein
MLVAPQNDALTLSFNHASEIAGFAQCDNLLRMLIVLDLVRNRVQVDHYGLDE